jgi:hypothetical protein
MKYNVRSVEDRFWEKADTSGECWEWTAGKFNTGYGQFSVDGAPQLAHRFSYEMHYGKISDGLHVLHTCDNPPCVNPEHLWLGTQADNNEDRDKKGRNGHSNKTHCPQGHPYSEDNLVLGTKGRRRACLVCNRTRALGRYYEHKDERLAYQNAYYQENREECLAYQRARYWKKKNEQTGT